jgi:hypothetical protein
VSAPGSARARGPFSLNVKFSRVDKKAPWLPQDGEREEVLAPFAKAGIDADQLAAQLQDKGAKSSSTWNESMAVIASKSALPEQSAAT